MKKSRKISVFVTLAVSLIFLGCSNPSSSGSGSGSNNGNGSTPTSGDNPDTTPTNPGNPSGGGNTPVVNPDPETPKYEWICTKSETTQEQHANNVDMEYSSISEYNYSYYNDKNNYKYTYLTTSSTKTTVNGTQTINNSETKGIYTSFIEEEVLKVNSSYYVKDGTEWSLRQESQVEYYDYKKHGSQFAKRRYTKSYPYSINGTEISGSESTTISTVELLNSNNNVEEYKVTYNSASNRYDIYEFKNKQIQKITLFIDGVINSISYYSSPNNSFLTENIPNYILCKTEIYNNGTLYSESIETLEDVIHDNTQMVVKTKTETINHQTGTSNTNCSYCNRTYKKLEIPFSANQQ